MTAQVWGKLRDAGTADATISTAVYCPFEGDVIHCGLKRQR